MYSFFGTPIGQGAVMYKHAYILSNNAPLGDFVAKRLKQASGINASILGPERMNGQQGRFLILVESVLVNTSGGNLSIEQLKARYEYADVIVFGNEDGHANQRYILSGARDFLTGRMLTSPEFVKYLKLRIERDWHPAIN